MIRTQITTYEASQTYENIFAQISGIQPVTPVFIIGNSTIATIQDNMPQGVLYGDLVGMICCIIGVGYGTCEVEGIVINNSLTDPTPNDPKKWCISKYEPIAEIAFNNMLHDILHGVRDINNNNNQLVQGILDLMVNYNPDILQEIDDTSTLFKVPQRHLTLHLMFRNFFLSEKYKDNAWDHYSQYINSIAQSIRMFAIDLGLPILSPTEPAVIRMRRV